MDGRPPFAKLAVATVCYLALFLLCATLGIIHPACYAYAGTLFPLLAAFPYLYVAANLRSPGAAALLNGFVLVAGLVMGEGNVAFVVGMVALTVAAEAARRACGYSTLRGVRLSFAPLAFSFYAYSAHWWTDTAGSLAAAVEEMPAGYADTMATVIANVPMLVVMLVLVVPVALVAMRLAERAMAGQAARLG